ncbi:MAG: sulfatase-like hydrolase/transferase [bacterium]|nr:sulfatase-like hydrolase/transferase [bacterium]
MKNNAIVLALVLSLLVVITGCARDAGDGGSFPDAPVILISIDTLRADRLPMYGYTGVETPAFDALREDALLFARAYSHCPLTLPSHASLLTGLLPSEHGVRDNLGYRLDAQALTYLPARLQRAGRPTGGAVSAYVLRGSTGLREGFDFYDDQLGRRAGESLGGSQRPGGETAKRALKWVRSVADRPFFLLFHLYEPHMPHEPPPPFDTRYRDPYDGEVAAADAVVGAFLDELRQLDLYDPAIIVLLSDHGEGLDDHGEEEHGILLYREALEVPLLLKLPRSRLAGERVEAPAQLIDLVPTLLSLVGLEIPESLRGRSLLELRGPEPAERPIYAETFYPRLHLGWSDLASLIQGRYHHIDGPDPELYDLVADPQERNNLVRDERRVLATLRKQLNTYDRSLTPPAAADEEARERLGALGYLGTTALATGPLPDPKERLYLLPELKQAMAEFSRGEYAEAVPRFRRLVADSPEMADAWEHLAQALQQLGRLEEAEEAFRRALEVSGAADHIALGAARLFLEEERLEDAREHAALALVTNPGAAHEVLAQIDLAAGQLAEAEAHARTALESDARLVQAVIVLAQTARRRDDLDGALVELNRAREILTGNQEDSPPPGYHFLRGDVLARLGRSSEAEREFREEIRLYPTDARPYTGLALLYALQGRNAEAVAALRRLVEQNPNPDAYAAAVETLKVLDPPSASALLEYALTRFPQSPRLLELRAGWNQAT